MDARLDVENRVSGLGGSPAADAPAIGHNQQAAMLTQRVSRQLLAENQKPG
jgi:hypothetical protein